MSTRYVGEELKVGDIMSAPPVKVAPDASVRDAAQAMKEHRVGGLVVVDSNESLIGIITVRDIVYRVVAAGLDPAEVKVRDVMTRNPYYVFEDDSVVKAAEIMVVNNVGHLPVLSPETFRVVGVISKRDIVKAAPELLTEVVVESLLGG